MWLNHTGRYLMPYSVSRTLNQHKTISTQLLVRLSLPPDIRKPEHGRLLTCSFQCIRSALCSLRLQKTVSHNLYRRSGRSHMKCILICSTSRLSRETHGVCHPDDTVAILILREQTASSWTSWSPRKGLPQGYCRTQRPRMCV